MKTKKYNTIIKIISILFFICSIILLVINAQNIDTNEIDDESLVITQVNIDDDFSDDKVIIVLKHNVSLEFKDYTKDDFSEIDCAKVEDLTMYTTEIVKDEIEAYKTGDYSKIQERIDKNMLVDIDKFHRILCLYLTFPGKENVIDAIKKLEKRNDIISAEPDYIKHIDSIPDDTYYSSGNQWGLNGTYGINAPKTWNYSTGNSNILVGVIDSGIDASHPDLANNINSSLHRDYVDHPSDTTYRNVAKSDLEDPNGHGTHVAGIIGACGNNTIGVTGVMQQVKLVSIRVADSSGHTSDSDIESAIDYASYCNIKVINLSLGGPDQLLGTKRAIEHYSGLVVCAAGNYNKDNDSNDYFPSNYNYTNLIAVGSIDQNGNKSSFSNYGATTVDIFAPGDSILSTLPTDICSSLNHVFSDSTHLCELDRDCAYFLQDLVDSGTATWANIEANFSTLAQLFYDSTFSITTPHSAIISPHENIGYHKLSGTSMAAPFVTGVAALMLSCKSTLTAEQIKSTIMNNATKYSTLTSLCVCGGRLDAFKAVSAVVLDTSSVGSNIQIDGFISGYTIPSNMELEIPNRFAQISSTYGTSEQDVNVIGLSAFYSDTNIKKVVLPNTITNIGSYAFGFCSNIDCVDFSLNSVLTNIGAGAFYGCVSLNEIDIPNSVTSLGSSTFKNSTSLSSITLPNSLLSISSNAFEGCSSLDSINLSNTLTSIGSSAFKGCTLLEEIVIPSTVTSIGYEAFKNCTSLETVTVNRAQKPLTTLGTNAFQGCSSLNEIIVPMNRIADYKNDNGWSSYSNLISPDDDDYPNYIVNKYSNINISSTNISNGLNKMYELDVNAKAAYVISVTSGTNPLIKLYNSSFVLIDSSSTSINEILLNGHTYYLSVEHSDTTTSGSIGVNIQKDTNHVHIYDEFTWYDYTQHKKECLCGVSGGYEPHAVQQGSFLPGAQYATCILCGGLASVGFVGPYGNNLYPTTPNGSYILPNGVIVLASEDIDSYLNGTLVFIDPNIDLLNNYNNTPYFIKREDSYFE